MQIVVKRVYGAEQGGDGYRVLVDRLWPRGVKKESLAMNEWCKAIAPSTELREWFHHDLSKFAEFRVRYQEELEASDEPARLLERAKGQALVLLTASKDPEVNHAVVLQEYLQGLGD